MAKRFTDCMEFRSCFQLRCTWKATKNQQGSPPLDPYHHNLVDHYYCRFLAAQRAQLDRIYISHALLLHMINTKKQTKGSLFV